MSRRKRYFVQAAGRVEMSGSAQDEQGRTTELQVQPRVLTMTSWDPDAWRDYHRGDRITVNQRLGDTDWAFHGVVLHKRLHKITLGESGVPESEER